MDVVTGATGHIGNTLVRTLLARGRKVRGLVLPSDSLRPLAGLEVEVARGDVRRPETLREAFAGADVVYHLASVIAISSGRTRLLEEVNVKGARNVAEACLEGGVRRLVYTSSIHALVEPAKGMVIDEARPFDPTRIRFPYGRSKARGTLEILACAQRGLDAVIVSPSGVIGPFDFGPSEMGRLFVVFAHGRIKCYMKGGYDFVDVRDVAAGHVAAAEKGRKGENYLLSGEQISVRELLDLLSGLTGLPRPRYRIPGWAADLATPFSMLGGWLTRTQPLLTLDSLSYLRSNSVASHAKAARELGYRPRPLRTTLSDPVDWLRDAGYFRTRPELRPKKRPARAPGGA